MDHDTNMKLGFGLMRLPRRGMGRTDLDEYERMVDRFLEEGGWYFDTARIYPGSEEATSRALVGRIPRENFTLATKLNALIALNEKQARRQLEKSLEKTGAGYFDYYLLHSLMDSNYRRYEKFHLWDYVKEKKREGVIRNLGFSFHGSPEVLDEILTAHPEVDFVQLQINYADWNNPKVQSRRNYEVARKHNVPIVVMEPVKGGKLANPPEKIQELFREADPDASAASWALRFVGSLDGIMMILSGMSSMEQMEDNLKTMKNFRPLDAREREIISQAQKILEQSGEIECTGCSYCVKGCPKEIAIPDVFRAYNLHMSSGQLEEARENFRRLDEKHPVDACISCRQCERACPQHLEIVSLLKEAESALTADHS